ncbi:MULTISPECIES: glycine zipper 2TM domain-containing protein [unclassified Candidatus Accumulibacter]|nr:MULTISPECIES: glycine zipper 2TM domain-containing protein [unclassified Candidatus Accumulibacter]HRE71403.1 glycine zipper 2TM domain-containing protein [Accumulibacter sp.]HRE85970.1 glycine zipper 2TM domain-containing protein [Accumulibacter sp.]
MDSAAAARLPSRARSPAMALVHGFPSRRSVLALLGFLAACAGVGQQAGEMGVRTGVVEQIVDVPLPTSHHAGVGAVVGGLAGLSVGSLIGAGSGRDVAMVLAAVGGAVAGNEVEKTHAQPVPGQQIVVRTGSGILISVTQPGVAGLRKGQVVYVEGHGDGARVVAR